MFLTHFLTKASTLQTHIIYYKIQACEAQNKEQEDTISILK